MKIVKRVISALLVASMSASSAALVFADSEKIYRDNWLDFNKTSKTVSGLPISSVAGDIKATVKNQNGKILSDGDILSTGCIISKDGTDFVLAIPGDVSGDGEINSTDCMQVRRMFLGSFELSAAAEYAADVNRDGKINSTDFMQIRKHFLGLFTVESFSFGKLLSENVSAAVSEELIENVCRDYYSLESHSLRNDLDAGWDTTLWPFGSFLEALCETYTLFPENETIKTYLLDALNNGLDRYKVTGDLETPVGKFTDITYYNASCGNRGDYYYDDNAWICVQLLHAYETFGDIKYLTKAEEILAFFETGIDDVLGGGLYWDKSYTCKNTCADGPAAIGYLWAYKLTGKSHYLERGKELVDWLNKTLRDNDGLYWDNQGTNGDLNKWKAFYNQGTPMYALSLLYEITGEKQYLDLLDTTATSALNYSFRKTWDNGLKTSLNGNPIYKAWCIGWLIRGFEQYVTLTGKCTEFYDKMALVLEDNLQTKDEYGYYDPYFRTGHYPDESKTEVLQTSGVTSIYALCAYYEVYIKPTL